MDALLTPVSRTYLKHSQNEDFLSESKPAQPVSAPSPHFHAASPEEALETLKNQPDYEMLLSVLKYLEKGIRGKHRFNILRPSPQSAQLVHVLVTEIVPNYWTVLKESSLSQGRPGDVGSLFECLLSITGLNAVVGYLRVLLHEAKADAKGPKQSHAIFSVSFIIDLLSEILQSSDQAKKLWTGVSSYEDNSTKLRALRQEFISLLTGSKIVSLSAEAEAVLQQADKLERPLWIADGKQYVEWLGRNLVSWLQSDPSEDEVKLLSDLLTRALKLGHSELLIQKLFTNLILNNDQQSIFVRLLDGLSHSDQRRLLLIVLKLLSSQLPNPIDSDTSTTEDYPLIWAAAAALKGVIGTSEIRRNHVVSWLTDATGAGIGENCGIRRAAVAVLSDNKETLLTVLEKSLSQFGDQLYIRHSPIIQQEAHAQVLLLGAGYVYRLSPIKLTVLLRSSAYLNGISNRIGASQNRARFLGMVVGEALSALADGKEKKLDFQMEETNSEEARWYKSLVKVSDKIGPISPLQCRGVSEEVNKTATHYKRTPNPTPRPSHSAPKSGFIIEEVEDDEKEEEDDLIPYAKPDSDAEDSDDDPTLINKNKPKAPVYTRDLISYLRDTSSHDHQKLALTTAPALIRRKANYGTEVTSHAQELATLLVGLQDHFELPDFHNFRLQGMVAILVAQPQKMGPWFAKTFFDGDYSLSQRASILVVLGLSGREMAGIETSEYADAAAFPSKQLPAKAEKYYALPNPSKGLAPSASHLKPLPPNAIDNISQSLSQTFLAPLAAEAADAATGPDALKLASLTSRLQQAKASKPGGIRSIPNTTASLVATSLFFPLTSRFQAVLHSTVASTRGILFQPELLSLYLKTLALLLHSAGPSTLALPQMTSEFWDLLLGVRGQSVGELGLTHAILFGLMTLLDVNDGDMRALCERHGRETVESMEWASGVFDRTRGGHGEENQVKMMAAGVLIRLREAVDKYQALLMGDLMGFT